MTNGDKIRSMTDEEIVENLKPIKFDCSEVCNEFEKGCYYRCKHNVGKEFFLNWLKAKAI